MAELTPYDQLLLELVNRARLNPAGEAARFGIRVNQDLPAGTIAGGDRQPLAPNSLLSDAALGHSNWMLNNDVFSHFGSGNSLPGDRMEAAGYRFSGLWNWGENVAWRGTTGSVNLESFTQQLHRDLFLSPSHRFTMLNGEFREAGIAIASGRFSSGGATYNAVMATENFAVSGSQKFITGVAIYDADGDTFYDIGEAHAGVIVTVSQGEAQSNAGTTASAGGYAVAFTGGLVDVTFSGGGLANTVTVTIDAGNQNAKVDLVNSRTVLSSATAVLGDGAADLLLLGAANIDATGNAIANTLRGNAGMNVLRGLEGNDTLIGGNDGDLLTGGEGRDRFDFNARSDSGRAWGTFDTITDFASGVDIIDLYNIDARTNIGGNQAFRWIGSSDFHNKAGELRFQKAGSTIIVSGDLNGDGKADLSIHFENLSGIARGDFIL